MHQFKFVVALLNLLLVSCTTYPIMEASSLADFKHSRSAVLFSLVEKKVLYSERLYQVLFLKYTSTTASFEGMWDIDTELTNQFVDVFGSLGFDVTAIPAARFPNHRPYITFSETKGDADAMRKELLSSGYKYFVEVNAPNIAGSAPGYGFVSIEMATSIRVTDLSTNNAVWSDTLFLGDTFQLAGDLKQLEKHDLKLLKAGVTTGVQKLLTKHILSRALGLT